MVIASVVTVAFNGDGGRSAGVLVELLTATPQAVGTPRPTAATPSAELPPGAAGFAYPIAGACLPADDTLMPGAPRVYRQGIHEGVDFYDSDNCASIGVDTEVTAAKAGRVVRADVDYEDLTVESLAELERRVDEAGGSDPLVEDAYRGRQVWIDHGGGIVTRYAHLSGVAEGIEVGTRVGEGEVIAYVGESGTPESVTAPGTQIHLHLEIRVGEEFLGEGLSPEQVRELYRQAFE